MYAGTWEEDTEVAVKVFKPEAINREYVKHCLDKLRSEDPHPGILPVHDHDLDGDPAYCIMAPCFDYSQDQPEPRTLESICGQMIPSDAWELIGINRLPYQSPPFGIRLGVRQEFPLMA